MDKRPTALERAFDLARNGKVAGIGDIRKTLAAEGYMQTQVTGRGLTQQLAAIIKARKDADRT